MPRLPGKPKSIAYKILGIPANIYWRRTEREREINRRLNYEETRLVR
jgi:hypothetical protein